MNPCRLGLILECENQTGHLARAPAQCPACLTLPATCPIVFSLAASLVPRFIRWQVLFSWGSRFGFNHRAVWFSHIKYGRACLKILKGAAARDFGRGQGGETGASPQRAVTVPGAPP